MAVIAATIADRSRAKERDVGFARRRGHRDVPGMLEKQGGVSGPEARRLIELGETLADAERAHDDGSSSGDGPARPVFSHVADAVRAGRMGTEASVAITRMLRRVADRCEADELARAEKDLVESARYMRLDRLRQLINRYEARLDAAHLEELAEARRQRRFLHVGENADGMIRVNGQLDPENGAPLLVAMDAMVNQHFRLRKRAQDAQRVGRIVDLDDRTPEQVRADAMGDFARHLLGCDVDVLPHSGVKVIVRMDYEALKAQAADVDSSIDGLSTTPDAGELRRFLARAGLIPQMLGGGSTTLDYGHERTGFTPHQKFVLLERDGGCAKCGAPPSWCDAHHVTPVEFGGRTDIANGVMLCVRCHHDVHRDGWIIKVTSTEVWFIPPAHLDPHRTPQPGGRRLFDAMPTPTELPDESEVLSSTPVAATRVGDARRRAPAQPGARHGTSGGPRRGGAVPRTESLACAMRRTPSVSAPDKAPDADLGAPVRPSTGRNGRMDWIGRARRGTTSTHRFTVVAIRDRGHLRVDLAAAADHPP
ncbi:HNH endonuclease signature motif containing protein [Demequina sp. NBRC 110057]|uniref:HNH endonuclease signature motif containing protein n=1 Tax=Demequina sp. NBRC 110057 TaxID=1570346 RepID=UPI001F37AFF3|nr:HNH endonuclease signature motif containing protein [Demequina sp. NBRC 110057]